MPLLVKCPCGKQLRVPDSSAGGRVKCPGCGKSLALPALPPAEDSEAPAKIRFDCAHCGKTMQARAEYAGRTTRCPDCGKQQTIPEEEAEEPVGSRIQADRPAPRKAAAGRGRDRDEEDEPVQRKRRRHEDEDEEERDAGRREEEEEEEPVRRKKRRDEEEEEEPEARRGKKKAKKGSMLPLVLGGVAVLLLMFAGCGGVGAWWFFLRGSGGDVVQYIPGDGQGFVSIRLADAWKAEGVQKAMAQARQQNPAMPDPNAEVEKEFGLGIADIERLTMVFEDIEKEMGWFIISTTKAYDQNKIKAKLKNATTATHAGKSYIVGEPESTPAVGRPAGMPGAPGAPGFPGGPVGGFQPTTKKAAICFLSDKMLLMGPEEGVKKALGVASNKHVKGALDDGVALLGGKQHLVAGFNLPADKMQKLKADMTGPAAPFQALADMRSGTLAMSLVGEAVEIEATFRFPDDKQAEKGKMAMDKGLEAAKGFLTLAKMGGGGPDADKMMSQLESTLNGIKFEQKGALVSAKMRMETSASTLGMGMMGGPMGGGFGPGAGMPGGGMPGGGVQPGGRPGGGIQPGGGVPPGGRPGGGVPPGGGPKRRPR